MTDIAYISISGVLWPFEIAGRAWHEVLLSEFLDICCIYNKFREVLVFKKSQCQEGKIKSIRDSSD